LPPAGQSPPTIRADAPYAGGDQRPAENPAGSEIPDAAQVLGQPSIGGEAPATPPTTIDRAKGQAQEMVAESLQLPASGAISGEAWPLTRALGTATDKKQQLAVIHSYWQLSEALAKYHFAAEQAAVWEQLRGRPADEAALRAARATAAATLRESELAVISAQHDLAALVQLSAEATLALPADKPHVGGYRTSYQTLFGRNSPPSIARVIDRTLPIRFEAIRNRASAAQAAQDAYGGATDCYQTGQTDFSTVQSAAEQLLHERRAFIETVCRYNHDIAEYAVAVLGPNVSAQQLVGALIEQGQPAIEPRPAEKAGNIQPTEYLQPIAPAGQFAPGRAMPGEPTPALRPMRGQPTLVPVESQPPATFNRSTYKPVSQDANVPEPGAGQGDSPVVRGESKPLDEPSDYRREDRDNLRDGAGPDANLPRTAEDRQLGSLPRAAESTTDASGPTTTPSSSTALYPALVEATPAVRAKQLTLALHWDRSLPENAVKPMTLAQCLARESGSNRRETLAVFWIARQRAAEYQAIVQEADFLENLASEALERRGNPAGAAEMLYLRAARLSAKAARDEAQAALVESQFELAIRTQSTAETVWPLASTPPHTGSYDLNLTAQPRQVVRSRPMVRLAATIPALSACIQQRATAVVEADGARSAAVEAYSTGATPLGPVLWAIARQTRESFAFLQTLTDYNRSMADFALTVLPADIPADKLAAALVVQP
jgi:hypothetical protein